jgi:hypothetical protein
MKKFLALFLILGLAIVTSAGAFTPPSGFAGKLWQSTFALYGSKGGATHFVCTAEPIARNTEGDGYILLTAGHCVQEIPEGVDFSVAEEVGGTLSPVILIKAHEGDGADTIDFALFNFKTPKKYFVFDIGDLDVDLQIGEKTLNPNFALALGKQLSIGRVSSMPIALSENCKDDGCLNNFLVQEYAGPGASGSAVLSAKTHKVLGILVYQFDGDVGFAVEPISRLKDFLAAPVQPHPAAALGEKDDPSIRIPETVFQQLFGEAHPFTLAVHGPNPRFTQAGWTFVVNTDGFELSDDYYYNVPVFIAENEDGTYRLTSTKDGAGVDMIAVQASEQK